MSLLEILAGPLLLLLLAVLVGARLPKTHVAASRVVVNAPQEEVWALISDFGGYAQWRPGLKRVELGPDIQGAPTWFEVCARNTRVQFMCVESDPPRRMVTRLLGEDLPIQGRWTYQLEGHGDTTWLTITEKGCVYSPLFRFFTRFVISYHGTMDVFLISLARRFGQVVRPEHLSVQWDGTE